MKVQELISELQKFPPEVDVELYAGKCCDVKPIHQVFFHPGDSGDEPMIVLVNET